MEEGRNGRQKVTRTLLATSLFICAWLFLFMVFGNISVMKEEGGKYLHYDFSQDGAPMSLLGRIGAGDAPPAVTVSTAAPELAQEQPALSAAGDASPENIQEPAAPARAAEAPPAADRAPRQEHPAAGREQAAAPRETAQAPATKSAGAVKARPGGQTRPVRQNAALPPPAEAATRGPARDWPAAGLAIDGILAGAGIIRKEDTFIIMGGTGAAGPMFGAQRVLAMGGRLGQGTVSMEKGFAAAWKDFKLDAQGLSSTLGPEAAGPRIPAGKAPALPSGHVAHIIEAAKAEGIDPALLAATAARESNFAPRAYRAEPHLAQVQWRKAPGRQLKTYYDGSIGPAQVLRSNFKAQGIDNDAQAYDLRNNYRVSARIIKSNLNYFPGNTWKAVAAYNVGKYGAKLGRIPANNYTDTIISWRGEYQKVLAPYE